MKSLQLSSRIESVPLVNEKRGAVLRDHGIRTVEDLLWYLPFRYEDWRKLSRASELKSGQIATISGIVTHITVKDSGGVIIGRFFNQPYLKDHFEKGRSVILHGVVKKDPFVDYPILENPQHEVLNKKEAGHFLQVRPVYERIGSITPKMLRWMIHTCLEAIPASAFGEPISEEVRKKYKLIDRKTAFQQLHFPEGNSSIEELEGRRSQGHRRLIFAEFFLLELGLVYRKKERPMKHRSVQVDDALRSKIKQSLPFRLTGAQKRVIREIVQDLMARPVMYRLLQGDVGSGKTILALMAAIVAMENQQQVAFMVPTEILAEQHYTNLRYLLSNTTYIVRLLSGSLPKQARGNYQKEIESGECHLVVGTHALIQDPIRFSKLGLVIIDEQHRFGVLQREALLRKGEQPDCLIMTATPIPRSLALTVYGDLDTSVLDEMPPGRKPIITKTRDLKKKAELYHSIADQIRKGKQAYVLCPLIEESEKLQLSAAEKLAADLRKAFPDLRIGLIHGSIPQADRENVMRQFLANEIQLLVATTVIEVGIDVPNASIMVIEHAERFGLSQLHQLRGRVGRGSEQSYCYLLIPTPSKLTEEAKQRIQAMTETQDGFKIAEKDLLIRGPGELTGTRQSGLARFRIADLLLDQKILEIARKEAFEFLETFKDHPESLKNFFQKYWTNRFGLIEIG
jgi:ATP-dependent DNA helicase RecG